MRAWGPVVLAVVLVVVVFSAVLIREQQKRAYTEPRCTIFVDNWGGDIQAAVDMAGLGDMICVAPGTYEASHIIFDRVIFQRPKANP